MCGWKYQNKVPNNESNNDINSSQNTAEITLRESSTFDNIFDNHFKYEDEFLAEQFNEISDFIGNHSSEAAWKREAYLCAYCGELENANDIEINCVNRISNIATKQVTDELYKAHQEAVHTFMMELATRMLSEWYDNEDRKHKSYLCHLCGWKPENKNLKNKLLIESSSTQKVINENVSSKCKQIVKQQKRSRKIGKYNAGDVLLVPMKMLASVSSDDEPEKEPELVPEVTSFEGNQLAEVEWESKTFLCAYCGELENANDMETNRIHRISNIAEKTIAAELGKTILGDLQKILTKITMESFSEWWDHQSKWYKNPHELNGICASKPTMILHDVYLQKKKISVESGIHRPFVLTANNTQALSQRLGCRLITDEYIDSFKICKSPIHGLGLFAKKIFKSKQFVIEYKGERVSRIEANRREKVYQCQGKSNCYLFGARGKTVIDATVRGNLARYINHSCEVSI